MSLGTAHVQYTNQKSAIDALNKYNGAALDGKIMKITIKRLEKSSKPGQNG